MAKEKRYYWLRFKSDFFDDLRIRKLQSIPGGDTYLVAYMKILARSIPTGGVVIYQGIFGSIEEEIALDINEDVKTVKFVLEFATNHKMAEGLEQGKYLLPYAVENIGSETASAVRMRRLRNNKKKQLSSQCDAKVTHMLQTCSPKVTLETDKEIDIETHTEIENDSLFEKWLDEYSADKKTPPAYKANMRKRVKSDDKDAVNTFLNWKHNYLENQKEKEREIKIKEFDYSSISGARVNGVVVTNVINQAESNYIDLLLEDGSTQTFPKEEVYKWIHQKRKENE